MKSTSERVPVLPMTLPFRSVSPLSVAGLTAAVRAHVGGRMPDEERFCRLFAAALEV